MLHNKTWLDSLVKSPKKSAAVFFHFADVVGMSSRKEFCTSTTSHAVQGRDLPDVPRLRLIFDDQGTRYIALKICSELGVPVLGTDGMNRGSEIQWIAYFDITEEEYKNAFRK